ERWVVQSKDGTRFDFGKHTTAKEKINYEVLKRQGNTVEISKKYSLRSVPEADRPSRFEMTGEGKFTFDMTEGVIKSLSMKYECRLNEKHLIRTMPISLSYHLLSAKELAEHQKKIKEARAKATKPTELKPFASGQRAKLLRDLRSADDHTIQTAADQLAKIQVDDQPAEIAKILAVLLGNPSQWIQHSAAEALVVWATPEEENELIKASQSEDLFLRNPAIEALGKLGTAKAAQAIAAQMYQPHSRHVVSKTLIAMGPVAENATLALLSDRDMWTRAEACKVLGEIGGKESLKALGDFLAKSKASEKFKVAKAISRIEQRLASPAKTETKSAQVKSKSSGKGSHAPDKNSRSEMRTWHDVTGTFSLEAAMLSLNHNVVVLEKQDGKTIRVPITKLSSADRTYANQHAHDVLNKAKPENPFEQTDQKD
ncbi:MAG: HEAT repeat domain-containing protein, partial [Thermoguttaceae bacterium]